MRFAKAQLGAAGLLLAGLTLGGCTHVETTNNYSAALASEGASVETLPAADLANLIAQGSVVLIDVRTPAEFAEGRLDGALNMPVQTFNAAAVPRDGLRETILYCRSSGRSKRAAEMLAQEWGTKVRHLEGGILAWRAADLPEIQ